MHVWAERGPEHPCVNGLFPLHARLLNGIAEAKKAGESVTPGFPAHEDDIKQRALPLITPGK